jgi:hypothetical protein
MARLKPCPFKTKLELKHYHQSYELKFVSTESISKSSVLFFAIGVDGILFVSARPDGAGNIAFVQRACRSRTSGDGASFCRCLRCFGRLLRQPWTAFMRDPHL